MYDLPTPYFSCSVGIHIFSASSKSKCAIKQGNYGAYYPYCCSTGLHCIVLRAEPQQQHPTYTTLLSPGENHHCLMGSVGNEWRSAHWELQYPWTTSPAAVYERFVSASFARSRDSEGRMAAQMHNTNVTGKWSALLILATMLLWCCFICDYFNMYMFKSTILCELRLLATANAVSS